MILLWSTNTLFSAHAQAATDLWQASVGQSWFSESRDWSGEMLSGTWWASDLSSDKRYRIDFEVDDLRGEMALLLTDEDAITIDRTGSYSYDFSVIEGGKRRMVFRAKSNDVQASVVNIVVSEQSEPIGDGDPDAGYLDPQGNIWQSSFGQQWFYEASRSPGQLLAGTWWESALRPGNTYKITFNVKSVRGQVGLLVGGNAAVEITEPGTYTYDFHIAEDGERRLMFQSLGTDVAVSVNSIWVTQAWSTPRHRVSDSSGSSARGHYVAFDLERNLKSEMLDIVQQPHTAKSNYNLNIAQRMDAALRTPGIKGIWMGFPWRRLEVGDGQYDWQVLDDNVEVARTYGLKFVVEIGDRSFNGTNNVLPTYFPSEYVLWSSGGGKSGFVSKRWDPYVYNRLIRLHEAIAHRYAGNPGFGGIATAETATGYSGGDYTPARYRQALTQVTTQTQAALENGKFFLYLNFLVGGDDSDMNEDQRVALLRDVPHANLVIGGPDITPDVSGMPRSVTNYRIHVKKTMPGVEQFCHLQHIDHGQGGRNVKSNTYRQQFLDEIGRVRYREQQYWFKGEPAVFQLDDLRDPNGNQVDLHPDWVLGELWQLDELFDYGQRNFGCDYVFWHYREFPKSGEFGWDDSQQVILNNPFLYE